MTKWWQDPRLDDEGTYDYLVEELPSDTAKWEWYYEICQSCGKEHMLNFDSTHYFYCYDGWDSMSYVECWRCKLKYKVHSIKSKIKKNAFKKYEQRKEYRELIKRLKEKNVPITKELKELALNICR
jgi:hypothetical protein